MGRKKLEIVKKPQNKRVTFYNKRRYGISKKATELAVLCDTDVLLLTVSPKGGHDLTLGPNSNFADVIRRYGRVDPEKREKKRHEGVDILCKAYTNKKDKDHQVDAEELLNHGAPKIPQTYKLSAEEMQLIDSKLGKLKHLAELPVIQDTVLLTEMEAELYRLLHQTNELIKQHQQMLLLTGGNHQAFPPQEGIMNNTMPSDNNNANYDSTPSSYVHQMIPRDVDTSTDPSVVAGSPAGAAPDETNEDHRPIDELYSIDLEYSDDDHDVMNGPQEGAWWCNIL